MVFLCVIWILKEWFLRRCKVLNLVSLSSAFSSSLKFSIECILNYYSKSCQKIGMRWSNLIFKHFSKLKRCRQKCEEMILYRKFKMSSNGSLKCQFMVQNDFSLWLLNWKLTSRSQLNIALKWILLDVKLSYTAKVKKARIQWHLTFFISKVCVRSNLIKEPPINSCWRRESNRGTRLK